MTDYRLGEIEARFADIIWRNEPLTSTELVRLCLEKLNWKKSTTYTVLKRLCEKGIFKNETGVVTSVITHDDFYSAQSEKFVNETFDGSLPAFFAAFTKRKKLTEEEIDEIKKLIAESEE